MFSGWRKRRIQDIRELEEEMKKIKEKTGAIILTFLGISDNIKGLNLICVNDEGFNSKLFAGRFAGFFHNLVEIQDEFLLDSLESSVMQTPTNSLLAYPVSDTVYFISLIPNKKQKKTIEDWFEKNQSRLINIFKN